MTADPIFFRDLAIVLVAAVLGAAAAWLTRQPLILGYVVGGLLVGPFTPGPTVSDLHTFELFADSGACTHEIRVAETVSVAGTGIALTTVRIESVVVESTP